MYLTAIDLAVQRITTPTIVISFPLIKSLIFHLLENIDCLIPLQFYPFEFSTGTVDDVEKVFECLLSL